MGRTGSCTIILLCSQSIWLTSKAPFRNLNKIIKQIHLSNLACLRDWWGGIMVTSLSLQKEHTKECIWEPFFSSFL